MNRHGPHTVFHYSLLIVCNSLHAGFWLSRIIACNASQFTYMLFFGLLVVLRATACMLVCLCFVLCATRASMRLVLWPRLGVLAGFLGRG